ncbi:MAG: DEAD/DEAH box helicase [Patescibacteria group bacterium]
MHNTTQLPLGFYGLGIAPKLLQILDKNGYKVPTPIQLKSIPIALEGKDMMGIAQTGTGKTLAFGVPMLQRLALTKGIGLVIAPTRELALQIEEAIKMIGAPIGLRTVVLIGGASMHMQIIQLKKNPHIIIATPGRLNDHLDQHTVRLDRVSVLVLDEADRMLDMGFEPQIKRILNHVPKQRQTMLFSATMPHNIVQIASSYMKLPVRVEIAKAGTAAEKVSHEVFFVRKEDKIALLEKMLEEHKGTVLVFSRTKHGASKIAKYVRGMGHTSAEIHSDRSLSQRKMALEQFKKGAVRILVATDIAARGIDVKDIELVINYDLPDQAEDYVHRIGRTGRAGQSGHAISFATPDQRGDVKQIERLMQRMLPISKTPELPKRDRRSEIGDRKEERTFSARSSHSPSHFSSSPRPTPHAPRPSSHRTIRVSSIDQDTDRPQRQFDRRAPQRRPFRSGRRPPQRGSR